MGTRIWLLKAAGQANNGLRQSHVGHSGAYGAAAARPSRRPRVPSASRASCQSCRGGAGSASAARLQVPGPSSFSWVPKPRRQP